MKRADIGYADRQMTSNFQDVTDLGKRQENVLAVFENLVHYGDIKCSALGRKPLSFEIDPSEANLLANGNLANHKSERSHFGSYNRGIA